jgi:glycyl-tRNA synthetase
VTDGHLCASYLRPETAQGHFLNFSRLLEFNNGRVPFASAQIGRSFRNEISPRAGLLRVREFTMAEIEHYVDPEDKRHERFDEVRDVVLDLLDRNVQASGSTRTRKISVGEAVATGTIANQTLGYFVARIYQFLVKIGIDPGRLRFRQHMANEMAHYAADCWDAEIQNSYGWTECVGCADRAAYDLTVHSNKTGHPLVVRQALKEPVITERLVADFNKKVLGKTFGKDAGVIQNIFAELDESRLLEIQMELAKGCVVSRRTALYPPTKYRRSTIIATPDGRELTLTPEVITIERKTFKQSSASILRMPSGPATKWLSHQSENSPQTSSSPRLASVASYMSSSSTISGPASRISSAE